MRAKATVNAQMVASASCGATGPNEFGIVTNTAKTVSAEA
jgi:hypothetical protein